MEGGFDSTRMSSKGQVVIPGHMRKRLKWVEGDVLALYEHQGMLILKKVHHPLEQKDLSFLRAVPHPVASSVDRNPVSAHRTYIQ